MKILKIYNEGLLDINELRLLGCSSKTNGDTIGKFGTGLKYSLAVLTRNDIDFNIYIGKRKISIQKEEVKIRDNIFEQVIIDYQTTSITTNLGVEWTVGQGLREFIANALDEKGGYDIIDEDNLSLYDGFTTITFDYDQIEQYLSDFDFDDWIEVEEGYYYKKLDKPRRAKVFKEGFLVYEADDNSSYDYRIDSLKINESRVAEDRHDVKRGISNIQLLMDKEDVEIIVKNKEVNLGIFYSYDNVGEGWYDINIKDISKNDGYELHKLIKTSKEGEKEGEQVNLLYSKWTKVNEDNEIEEDIFLQDEEFEEDWDIDLNTLKIYIGRRFPESYYIDCKGNTEYSYTATIKEAKRYREAAEYIKNNNLKTAINTTRHFLDIIQATKVPEIINANISLSSIDDKVFISVDPGEVSGSKTYIQTLNTGTGNILPSSYINTTVSSNYTNITASSGCINSNPF